MAIFVKTFNLLDHLENIYIDDQLPVKQNL